jgi:hypothetical protein
MKFTWRQQPYVQNRKSSVWDLACTDTEQKVMSVYISGYGDQRDNMKLLKHLKRAYRQYYSKTAFNNMLQFFD